MNNILLFIKETRNSVIRKFISYFTLCVLCIILVGCEKDYPTYVDIDIDSDNNNVFVEPDRSLEEDKIEDDFSKPGRIIVKNDDDYDGDQVADFADGFNLDGILGNEDDINLYQQFVPLVVEVLRDVDLKQARIRIIYDESIPADTKIHPDEPPVYEPEPGTLRIWAKPGDVERNTEHIAQGGDFVIPSEYSPEQLGFNNSNRTVTWYAEGIQTSRDLADQKIIIEVDPDGPGPAKYGRDIVRLTVVDFQFKTQGPDGELIEQEFTYNSVPAPQIHVTVHDCQVDSLGLVTMTVSGTVSDQISGIVSNPSMQLQQLTVFYHNQAADTIDLANIGEPEYPWQPYRFQSKFSTTVELQTHPVQEEYLVFLKTSENPAGIAAELTLFVFCNGSYVYCIEEMENDAGTYIPTIMRVDAPENTFTQAEATIHICNHDWPLAYKDIGDGNFWYAMDNKDYVLISLPAFYEAKIHLPNIWQIDERIIASIRIYDKDISFTEFFRIYGLIIDNESINSYLDLSLTNFSEGVYNWGNIKKYVYRPMTGGAKAKNNSLDTEIKFRYINHADGISGCFKNAKQFKNHVNARQKVVLAARSVKDWSSVWKPTSRWTEKATVRSQYNAYEAIDHAFSSQKDYGMGCFMAAILVMERGICLGLDVGLFNNLVLQYPFGLYENVIMREGTPVTGGSSLLKDKVKWIPGDWGFILNPDPKAWEVICTNTSCGYKWTALYSGIYTCPKCGSPGELQGLIQGENIIYLGGPKQGSGQPIGNFELYDETKFKNSAYFWGHIPPSEMTLQQWFNKVDSWSSQQAQILDHRDRIRY